MTDDKFLDPKQNPFIKIGNDDIPVRLEDEEPGPIGEDVEGRIPMGGYIYPEKKAAAASSSPDLAGMDRIKDFMKGRTRYPVHSAQDDFLYDIVADGDTFLIENSPGQRRQLEAGEIQAINGAISREILRQNPKDQVGSDNLEKNILDLMAAGSGGSYEIVIEDGTPTPLFNIIRTADGELEFKTPEGEVKRFADLTNLEKKLIQHDFKIRREFWGKRIG